LGYDWAVKFVEFVWFVTIGGYFLGRIEKQIDRIEAKLDAILKREVSGWAAN
jgi:hypothetical protein